MPDDVSARVLGLAPCSVPSPSSSVKTISPDTVPFRGFLQYLRDCLAFRNDEFAEPVEKYI